jgi:hypothetical protein
MSKSPLFSILFLFYNLPNSISYPKPSHLLLYLISSLSYLLISSTSYSSPPLFPLMSPLLSSPIPSHVSPPLFLYSLSCLPSSLPLFSLSVLLPSRVRVWQWGLDVRTVLHAALNTLRWLQRQGLIDTILLPSSSPSSLGQDSKQTVAKEIVKDREGENSDIFRERYNRHFQWIQRARKICVTSISTNTSRNNGGRDQKSLLQLLSPLYLEHKVLGSELKVLGPSDERDKIKVGHGNTGGCSGGGSGEESIDLIEADWSEALSGEHRAVQYCTVRCSALHGEYLLLLLQFSTLYFITDTIVFYSMQMKMFHQ